MKIKLSKSQWEGIGKKAGWMKKVQGVWKDSPEEEIRKLHVSPKILAQALFNIDPLIINKLRAELASMRIREMSKQKGFEITKDKNIGGEHRIDIDVPEDIALL